MYQLDVKKAPLDGNRPISWHLAHDIYARMEQGKIIIVTDKPGSLLSATRKKWHKLMRQIQRERSSILSGTRSNQLLHDLAIMEDLVFSAKPPEDLLEADVTFATLALCLSNVSSFGFSGHSVYSQAGIDAGMSKAA